MMDNLDLTLFYDESFVDFIVKDTKVNLARKDIVITTMGAWLDRNENNVLSETKIFIKGWYALHVSVMNEDTKVFTRVNNIEEYILSDIIKFYHEQNILRFIGFGANGGWVEWEFIKPEVIIQGCIECTR
jgi:hypothetical protein